ncbi:MAG: hypothetical protein ACRDRP_23050 [Pseudonocardiaceae bacterium]
MSVKPPERHGEREAGRMAVVGRCTDDGSDNTLLVVHENNGQWTFHGLGAHGVRISRDDAIGIARGILAATRSTP